MTADLAPNQTALATCLTLVSLVLSGLAAQHRASRHQHAGLMPSTEQVTMLQVSWELSRQHS